MTVREAAGSQRTQDDQVKEMLDAGCNVLCVNLVDRASASEIIDLAREKDVPVIFFNREPVAEDLRQWEKLYYVGADARQSGSLQGELAADLIWENVQIDRNRDGKIPVSYTHLWFLAGVCENGWFRFCSLWTGLGD